MDLAGREFESRSRRTRLGFAQKVDPIWNEPVSTGSAGALARPSVRSTLNLKPLDAATISRFALIAGEGARAPSISLSLSAHSTLGKATRLVLLVNVSKQQPED
jgi:hypothetical protein